MKEKTIHPTMFRNRPIIFSLCVLLSPVGLGLIVLLIWYIDIRNTKLTITPSRITYEEGVFSKSRSEVNVSDIRNIRTRQRLLQRILGVGNIGISTAGQSNIEIVMEGVRNVEQLKHFINNLRDQLAQTNASWQR